MRLQRRRFNEPSDARTFPHGRVEVVELDDTVVGHMVYEPGWRWSVDVKPIAGTDLCQYHHLGVTTSGRLAGPDAGRHGAGDRSRRRVDSPRNGGADPAAGGAQAVRTA
jgi:hypothetical protein